MGTYFICKGYFMFFFITRNLIWQEGLPFIIVLAIVALLGLLLFRPLVYIALFLFIFCFHFFRNPERICAQAVTDDTIIVCPADGKIVDISYDPQAKLAGQYHQKISIFMSPLDVHVNWIPISGTITQIEYVPGKFMMAFLPKSSLLNEHNDVVIAHISGKTILVRQIAGTLARRIVCWAQPNDAVIAGQKYGMIKFSSRIDLFLPATATIEVTVGQRVYGGQTVLGKLL